MNNLKPHTLCLSILIALATVPAHAQQTDGRSGNPATDDASLLDQIVVTARRVEEDLQSVPLPVTALDREAMDAAGIDDISDLAAFTPSFSFRQAFGRTGDRPVIRGMSNIQGEPNASFFIDGVFVEGSISAYPMQNLERVEVVRGPQAAQFGRRTFSGAVNYVTRAPGDEYRSGFRLHAAEGDEYGASGYFSGPLSRGVAAFEVSAGYSEYGGQYTNTYSGRKDVGGEQSQWFGAQLFLTPNEDFDLRFRVNYSEADDEHWVISRLGSDRLNCFLPGQPGSQPNTRGYYCGRIPNPLIGLNTPEFEAAGFAPGLQREQLRTSLTANWNISDTLTLTSITAYNDDEESFTSDQDFSISRGFGGAFETIDISTSEDVSQELRLYWNDGGAIDWMVGGYYYKQEPGRGQIGSLTGFFPQFGTPAPSLNPTDPDAFVKNLALFGMLNWRFGDDWTLTLEGRFAEDEIRSAGVSTFAVQGSGEVFQRSYVNEESFDNFTPRITLAKQLSADTLVYGLAAKGTKPGGFNLDVESAQLTDESRADLISRGFLTFEEEEAWTYEVGFKSEFYDRRMRLNGALFLIDWDKQQLTETAVATGVDGIPFVTSYTANLGESRVTGVELEYEWRVSESFDLRATASYLDTEIRNFTSPDHAAIFGDPQAAGNELPLVPKTQGSLSGTYYFDLANWGGYFRTDVLHEGSRYAQVHNLAETGASTVVNMRLGFEHGGWDVSAYVNNLTDDRTAVGILRYLDPDRFMPAAQNFARDFAITLPRQRQVGVEVRYDF